MKRYIKTSAKIYSDQNISSVWYICVPKGADPRSFDDSYLGIFCGSKEQAEEICSSKYQQGNCDIYRLKLNPNVTFSNPISDYDNFCSVDAVAEILSDGFNIPTSIAEVAQAYRNGEWDKSSAGQYIIQTTGLLDPIVVFNNAVELPEQDIIILDPNSIQSIELVNDVEACDSITSSTNYRTHNKNATNGYTSVQYEYVYKCLEAEPPMPESDSDDDDFYEDWWSESGWFRAEREYKHRCFADAVEAGIFGAGDYDSFADLWDKVSVEQIDARWS